MRKTIYVSRAEALDSKEARKVAYEKLGTDADFYRVSSVQPNRSRGGWSFCFKEVDLEK